MFENHSKLSHFTKLWVRVFFTLGQISTFYPEITKNLMFEKCEFYEKWDFEIVNFVKNDTLKKCEFCKNKTLKLWIQNVNFWINCGFLP